MSHSDGFSNFESYQKSIVQRITGALTLISIGVFFLLNSTGVIPWSSWGTVFLIFLRIWPVFIIIAGLQIIFGKNSVLSILLSIISSLVFVTILAFAAYVNLGNSALKTDLERNIPFFETFRINLNQENNKTTDLSIPLKDYKLDEVKQREINFSFTSEDFDINTSKSNNNYLDLNANYYSNTSEPYLNSSLNSNKLVIDTGVKNLSTAIIFLNNSKYIYTIGQTQVPTDLHIKMTSGDGQLNLSDLNLDNLVIDETSGNISTDLSKATVKKVNLQITSGNSELTFSKNSLVKLTFNKTSGNISVNNSNIGQRTGTISIGDSNAESMIDVTVTVTSGNVDINTK